MGEFSYLFQGCSMMAKKKKSQDKKVETTKEPRPNGRPTDYREEYCQMLIDHMAEGYTFASFAGDIGVHKDSLYEWCDKYPSFSEAKKIGRAKQMKANEKLIRDIAKYGDGNATAAIFILKNCHPKEWRDRRELELQSPKEMSKEDLIKEAKELIAREESQE
jgi:hypothetical protein